MTIAAINFFALEREAASFRVRNEIGLLKKYDETGKFTHSEATEEFNKFSRVLAREDKKSGKERLYFKVPKVTTPE